MKQKKQVIGITAVVIVAVAAVGFGVYKLIFGSGRTHDPAIYMNLYTGETQTRANIVQYPLKDSEGRKAFWPVKKTEDGGYVVHPRLEGTLRRALENTGVDPAEITIVDWETGEIDTSKATE